MKIKVQNVKQELSRLKRERSASRRAQAAVLVGAMTSDLKAATPVDTGHARDSWKVTTRPDGELDVENTAEYIQRLNEGSSQQAPARFVETTALKYGTPYGTIVEVKR